MNLAGLEVRMVTHACFSGQHRHNCPRRLWWQGEHDRGRRRVPCECRCHERPRGIS